VKILVPLKRVPDPELKTKIKDGAIDLTGATWVVNTFDEYAVEAALRLVENASDASRQGEDKDLDAGVVVAALSAVIAAEKPDLVLMGKQAVDGDANQVAQMLAAKLSLPQATFAATIERAADGKSVTVGREVDAGVEYKKVPLPAVVTVDLRIISPRAVVNHITPDSHEYQEGPRYASLKGIMQAKKKPLDQKTLADLGVQDKPVTRQVSVELPPPRAAGRKVESVQELVKALHDEAKVI